MAYLFLLFAILSEVAATTALKASESFTQLWPSVIVVLGYGAAFYFLSLSLQSINIGAAYAMWSGAGIVLVTIAGAIIYSQRPDTWAIVGMGFIITGVVIMNTLSNTTQH